MISSEGKGNGKIRSSVDTCTHTHAESQQNKSIDMTELLKMNCAKKTARADANNNELAHLESDYRSSGNYSTKFLFI